MASSRYSYSLHIAAYGRVLEMRSNRSDLIEGLLNSSSLPYGSHPAPPANPPSKSVFHLLAPDSTGGFRMRRAGRTLLDVATPQLLFEGLHPHLMVTIAEHAQNHLFVHAGVVGWQGRAILLPGVSFAGKTTLTAELVRAGATYYSDEYALIDRDGHVHPFARALQMRAPGSAEQRGLRVDELGGIEGVHPLPVGAILFVQYQPGAVWKPEAVTPAMAVMEMIRHTPAIRRIPAEAMRTLSRVTQSAPAFRSLRGEGAETAELILKAFGKNAYSATHVMGQSCQKSY